MVYRVAASSLSALSFVLATKAGAVAAPVADVPAAAAAPADAAPDASTGGSRWPTWR